MFLLFVECQGGFYGRTCNETCGNCANGQPCDKGTGKCLKECKPHFQVPYCKGIVYMSTHVHYHTQILG